MSVVNLDDHINRITKLGDELTHKIRACIKTKYPNSVSIGFDIPEFSQAIISHVHNCFPELANDTIYTEYSHVISPYCACKHTGYDYCNWSIICKPFWL